MIKWPRSLATLAVVLGASCAQEEPRACQPPRADWQDPPITSASVVEPPPFNRITITSDSRIRWNGLAVSDEQLRTFLKKARDYPEYDVVLTPEMGLACSTLERVRDEMQTTLGCKKGSSRCVESATAQ